MISKEKKAEIIKAYGRKPEDTGSPEVQIAILTERITAVSYTHLGFRFKRHPSLNLPQAHLTAIEDHIQARVRQLLAIPSCSKAKPAKEKPEG